jgi:hypothetical protein
MSQVVMLNVFFEVMQLLLISDVNECEEGLHNCDALTQVCINTHGSFQCQNQQKVPSQLLCPVGFELDKESQTCVGG